MDTIDESRGTVADTMDLDVAIARHATAEFDDSTSLADAGLESLSLIRLAVEAATDEDAEIDATRLVDIHTIGDLKVWLRELAAAAAEAQAS
ncbi:phosphopantetheine-binding protein [Nocardia sp. CDC159]|uniref:Phosphopantetheine-binding protein n=1 Tax=Nocardia pulmonis TaxID=2951408 RepID=A0A9X2IWV7_9NOCA|nr:MULTISPECIES: phosphopantetheine-binding protein [Nocardia]MCM6773979.1 phosphopantetheine-binding protein [Nocardia pulmonis]MCM6786866.1 phosphopantetheine-binding protein [Nocardia sp. CDC159]